MADAAEICELVLRVALSLFGLVGLWFFAMGTGIAPMSAKHAIVLKVVNDNHKVVMMILGPIFIFGAVGMWGTEFSEDIGATLVPIAHLGLISPPIGAVYCHKKTGEPLAPPIVVTAMCLAHLVLWLTINEDAVAVTVAVLVVVAVEASVAAVVVLLSKSETTTEVQEHSPDESTSEQARVDVGGEQVDQHPGRTYNIDRFKFCFVVRWSGVARRRSTQNVFCSGLHCCCHRRHRKNRQMGAEGSAAARFQRNSRAGSVARKAAPHLGADVQEQRRKKLHRREGRSG